MAESPFTFYPGLRKSGKQVRVRTVVPIFPPAWLTPQTQGITLVFKASSSSQVGIRPRYLSMTQPLPCVETATWIESSVSMEALHLNPKASVPQGVTILRGKIYKEVIKLKWGR